MTLRLRKILRTLFGAALAVLVLTGNASAATPTILVWGDSLSAGYGLDARTGWVYLLEQKLKSQASAGTPAATVVNGSVSGETSYGGLARLPAALAKVQPQIVLIELGANDGLRGMPVDAMRSNLARMVDLVKAAGAQPVLFEMRIPNNYGPAFTEKFRTAFGAVAAEKQVPMVPFFLAAFATEPSRWFQDDGIHPNAAAQPKMLEAVWPTLQPLLKSPAPASRRASRP